MVTVHLTVALVPVTTPVIVVVGDDGVVIVADPLISVQTPAPTGVTEKVDDPLFSI